MSRPLAVLSLLLILLCVTTQVASAATKPSCASPVPPTLPGPLTPASATPGIVLINEVMPVASNKIQWNCTYANMNQWVELYNPQNQPLDLYSVHASLDSGPNTPPFYLPFGSAIPVHGFLVIFPITSSIFPIAPSTLRMMINGVVIDQVIIPSTLPDQSYARIPDGTNLWQVTSKPTIDASNGQPQGASPVPTAKTGTKSGSNGTSNTGGTSSGGYSPGSGNNSTNITSGAQPNWKTLQFPTVTAAATPSSASLVPSTNTPPPATLTDSSDTLHKIIITALLLAFALSLYWCWKLFRSS